MAFSSTGSIFGTKPQSLFPQANQQQPSTSFGGNTTTTSAGTGTQPQPSIFGGSTTGTQGQTGGIFGSSTTNTQQPQTSLFGTSTTTTQPPQGGLFGSSTTSTQQPATNLFGSTTTTTQQPQTNLFGSTTTNPQQQPTTSLFGGTAPSAQAPQTSLFGSSTTSTQQPTAGVFGSTTGQQQPQTGGLFGTQQTSTTSTSGGLFGSWNAQQQQQTSNTINPLQPQPPSSAVVITKTTKFNDLPEDARRDLEMLDSFIQSQIQISKELHQRKLGEEPLKSYELIKGVHKDFVDCYTTLRHDWHSMRDLKAKVDREVEDIIIATRIVDGFRNPQAGGPTSAGYLKEHAGFPFEFFSRVTEQITTRLVWYKSTIEQIERKLTSTPNQAQTPHSIAAALQAQHQTFLALASKTATLDAELIKIKTLYTQLWRQKTGSMRDPFDEMDKNAAMELDIEALPMNVAK